MDRGLESRLNLDGCLSWKSLSRGLLCVLVTKPTLAVPYCCKKQIRSACLGRTRTKDQSPLKDLLVMSFIIPLLERRQERWIGRNLESSGGCCQQAVKDVRKGMCRRNKGRPGGQTKALTKLPGVVLRRMDEKVRAWGGWRCSSVVEFIPVLERKNWKSCLGGGVDKASPQYLIFPGYLIRCLGRGFKTIALLPLVR